MPTAPATHWIALLAAPADAQQAVGSWALQFSPRVALEDEAVLLEASASLRLFGGAAALHARLAPACSADAAAVGVARLAQAPTALAALAAVRAALACDAFPDVATLLDRLPLETLTAARPAAPMLARLGCRTLADVARLPRAGLARRFGQALVDALDRLQGRLPDALTWLEPPPRFATRHELPFRVEHAGALLTGARRLLLALQGWLAARQAGVAAFTLAWQHDSLRSRDAADGGTLTVRCATPTRDPARLERLLAEHLRHVVLAAPVGELRLEADDIRPLAHDAETLLPADRRAPAEAPSSALDDALACIAIRLGAERVLRPRIHDDHRPEHQIAWLPHDAGAAFPAAAAGHDAAPGTVGTGAGNGTRTFLMPADLPPPEESRAQRLASAAAASGSRKPTGVVPQAGGDPNAAFTASRQRPAGPDAGRPADPGSDLGPGIGPAPASWQDGEPRPAWLLARPRRLPLVAGRPALAGEALTLIAGPHRIEGGWWLPADTGRVERDYWVATDRHRRLLWIYRDCARTDAAGPWYWQGMF